MKKKNNLSGALMLLAGYLVFLGLVVGIRAMTNPGTVTDAPSAAAPATDAGRFTPGTYTATDSGFGGDVTVTLTVSADRIDDVILEGEEETPAIGGKALDTLREQILTAQSAEIDGVSGATLTSTGVKNAAAKAFAQATGTAEK